MDSAELVVERPRVNAPDARTAFKPLKLSSRPTHSDGCAPKQAAPLR